MNRHHTLLNIQELSHKLGLKINNPNLYQQAFTHKKNADIKQTYERLEFLGDSVLNFIICDYLYNRYEDDPNVLESFLTDLKIKLVNSDILSWLCQCLDIVKFILSVNHFKFTNSSINEDIFEALTGAILLDHDFNVCKSFIVNIIENPNFIDMTELILNDTNYKKKLFIYFQKKCDGRLPIFHTLYLHPSFNKHKYFHVAVCSPNGKILGFGISNTLKMAQQSACKNAFEINDFTQYDFNKSDYKVLYSFINHNNSNNSSNNNLTEFNNNSSNNNSPTNNYQSQFIQCKHNLIQIEDIYELFNNILPNIQYQSIDKDKLINYQKSFIHKSYYNNLNIILNSNNYINNIGSNEKLNFLGNSLLIYVLSKYLYHYYPNEKEGVLTKIKTSEIQSKNLIEMCKKLNLHKFYIIYQNENYNDSNTNIENYSENYSENYIDSNKPQTKNLDEIFCSILASIYLDQGIDFVEQFIIKLWNINGSSKFDTFTDENWKHKLLLKIQENPKYKKYLHPYPKYVLISQSNKSHQNSCNLFITQVYDPDNVLLGQGIGNTKRLSEQNASKNAIETFYNN